MEDVGRNTNSVEGKRVQVIRGNIIVIVIIDGFDNGGRRGDRVIIDEAGSGWEGDRGVSFSDSGK